MRPDMHKVITESPRQGHRAGLHERNSTTATRGKVRVADVADEEYEEIEICLGCRKPTADDCGCPAGTAITKRPLTPVVTSAHRHPKNPRRPENGGEGKGFSDLLGPLRSYLRKQIGRPWNKVYSEIVATVDRRNISGSHFLDHVARELEEDCYIGADKLAYSNNRKFRWYGRGDAPIIGLYVHPKTGLLQEQIIKIRRDNKAWHFRVQLGKFGIRTEDSAVDAGRYRIDSMTVWEKRIGLGKRPRTKAAPCWFIHRYEEIPTQFLFKTLLDGRVVDHIVPAHIKKISTKQASREEIQRARVILEKAPF